eukprot:2473236-Alexandrium_andersonii.AAC.1
MPRMDGCKTASGARQRGSAPLCAESDGADERGWRARRRRFSGGFGGMGAETAHEDSMRDQP